MQTVKNNSSNKYFPIFKLLMYIISFISFILCFIFDKIYLIILSIPFMLLVLCFIHEMGHYIGCKIKNKKVKYVKIFSIKYENNSITIVPEFNFGGVCSFLKDESNSKLVYILGPLFSLITVLVILFLYLIIKVNILFVLLILSIITLICVCIPYRGSDIYNLFTYGGKNNG